MQSNMLQSSSILGVDAPLSPVNARTMAAATMTAVNPLDVLEPTYVDLGVASYSHRDQELLQRDLTVASYIAQLGLQIATVWNVSINSLILPSVPPNILEYNPNDLRGGVAPATPANVDHVENSGVPYDAYSTDQDLYGRDAVIYEALARMSFSFLPDDRLIEPLDSNIQIDNTWSRSKACQTFGDVSVSDAYARNTFFAPDRYLASRDNVIAFHAASVDQFLINVLNGANRLLLRVQSTGSTTLYPTPIAN